MEKTPKEQGIHARNRDFSKFDQVVKPQNYRLVEDSSNDEFDEEYSIKSCDLSLWTDGNLNDKKAFAKMLGTALEGIGFAILTDHGVDTNLYLTCQEKIKELFENTPLEEKLKFKYARNGSINEGYFPIKETTVIHPDLVEGWVFCRRAFDLDGNPDFDHSEYWPDSSYEVFFRNIVQSHEQLIIPVMQSILMHLSVDLHLYDAKLAGTNFGFRLNYYPSLSNRDLELGAGRMLGHEDVDLFTLLPAQEVEGLQVLNRENGKWVRLNPEPGSIILNTGDYMQRISNDRLPSTTHRVSTPRSPEYKKKPRITFPMAIYIWEHEILEVLPGLGKPKYDPISAIKFHTQTTSKYYGMDYAVE